MILKDVYMTMSVADPGFLKRGGTPQVTVFMTSSSVKNDVILVLK